MTHRPQSQRMFINPEARFSGGKQIGSYWIPCFDSFLLNNLESNKSQKYLFDWIKQWV
jgi:hypothetical protein